MLDEPLGSLDRNLRERLVNELHDILKEMHQTAIYVTHDQEEAFAIADRVILLNSGRLEQAGTPVEIYMHPASLFVARFLEMTNIIPGEIRTLDGTRQIITSLGNFPVDSPHEGLASLLIRPDQVRLDESGPHILRGIIMEVGFRGSMQKVTVAVNHVTLIFDLPSLLSLPAIATEVSISLDPKTAIQVFPNL
jgi:ABC-type Fe3+/spermidine/putrescine transport system ATPase subunit